MPRETIHLPTERPLAPLSSIVFLSVLAYPSEPEKREKFETAAKAWMVKKWIEQGTPRETLPKQFRDFPTRAIENKFDQLIHRITERRIDAARLATELMLSASPFFGTNAKRAARGPRQKPGLNTAINLLTSEIRSARADDATNVRQRIWVESKPVIHLAVAFWEKFKVEGGGAPQRLIAYPDLWLRDTLIHAEKLRALYLAMQSFEIEDTETIALIPAP